MLTWEELPPEVLEFIVQCSTRNTRNALRACSTTTKILVESTPVNSLEKLDIEISGDEENPKFEITTHKGYVPTLSSFPTFELFQKELLNILKLVHCVDYLTLTVKNESFEHAIELANHCEFKQTILVENLEVDVKRGDQLENILLQMEPMYLRNVKIDSDCGNARIYDMRQMIHAEIINIQKDACIREDQLLMLNAKLVDMTNVQCSLTSYIGKVALEMNIQIRKFSFRWLESYAELLPFVEKSTEKYELNCYCPHRSAYDRYYDRRRNLNYNRRDTRVQCFKRNLRKEHFLETSDPNLKLRVTFEKHGRFPDAYSVEGCMYFDFDRISKVTSTCSKLFDSVLRRMESMTVFYCEERRCWSIQTERKCQRNDIYGLETIDKLQTRMDKILANVDRIENMTIPLPHPDSEGLTWESREKKLVVRNLALTEFSSEEVAIKVLQQIDPIHLKTMKIELDGPPNSILDMPHMLNLTKLSITSYTPWHGEYPKVETPAKSLYEFHATRALTYRKSLDKTASRLRSTEKKINAYIKNCLLTIDERSHEFEFKGIQNMNIKSVLKGIFNITLAGDNQTVYIPPRDRTSEYVLKLSYTEGARFFYPRANVSGTRILRSTIPLPYLQTKYAYFM